jgi:ABC-2 type transport system ATP-binding protein
MASAMLEVANLSRQFKNSVGELFYAVKDVSFSIERGEIFSLLGPNGAGKTTTISMISGLLAPTRGDATIGGYSISRQPLQAKRLLGIVPQEIALYPQLSARQNLEFFGKMYDLFGAALKRRVDEVIEFIDLRERQHDRVDTFSGGMKRRVNIGIGLLHEPQLLFLDEPTVGIDPQNRRRILDTVMRLRAEKGVSVLYTSHLMEEVQEISDRVAIVDHGEIIACGTAGELIQLVGEEDRLIFNIGDQPVTDALLARLQAEVQGVTAVRCEQRAIDNGGKSATVPAESQIIVMAKRGRRALPDLIRIANEAGLDILSVEVREPDLAAVFLHMTGRALRD